MAEGFVFDEGGDRAMGEALLLIVMAFNTERNDCFTVIAVSFFAICLQYDFWVATPTAAPQRPSYFEIGPVPNREPPHVIRIARSGIQQQERINRQGRVGTYCRLRIGSVPSVKMRRRSVRQRG